MRKILLVGFAGLTLAGLPLAGAVAMTSAFNDWVVVPKLRVGPIGKYTSVQALRSFMPSAVLRHQTDRNGDKTTVLYRKTNRNKNVPDMIIRWKRKHRVISQITLYKFAGPWRTVMGIRMNTSLDSVHKANGVPFTLHWRKNFFHAKSFTNGKVSRHFHFAFRQPAGSQTDTGNPMPAVINSDHPRVRGKNFRIIGMVVFFP